MSPKLRILIPLLIIAGFQAYTWTMVLLRWYYPTYEKGIALILLLSLFHFYFTRRKWCVVFTGKYILLLTFNLISITPAPTGYFIGIGPESDRFYSPSIQFIGVGLLVIYGI